MAGPLSKRWQPVVAISLSVMANGPVLDESPVRLSRHPAGHSRAISLLLPGQHYGIRDLNLFFICM